MQTDKSKQQGQRTKKNSSRSKTAHSICILFNKKGANFDKRKILHKLNLAGSEEVKIIEWKDDSFIICTSELPKNWITSDENVIIKSPEEVKLIGETTERLDAFIASQAKQREELRKILEEEQAKFDDLIYT